jgi:hypothetical protein
VREQGIEESRNQGAREGPLTQYPLGAVDSEANVSARRIWWGLLILCIATSAFAVLYYPLRDGRVHFGTFFGTMLLMPIPVCVSIVWLSFTLANCSRLKTYQYWICILPTILFAAGVVGLLLIG